jgi:hypothetical protein
MLAAALVLATGCTAMDAGRADPVQSSLPVEDSSSPMPAVGTCHVRNEGGQVLPDPGCTPGALNPDVTQDNITTTICQSGWTDTVRPPVSVTNQWKAASARSYGLSPQVKGEYDHLVALELGGAPLDPRNLWMELGTIPNPKDAVEGTLKRAVCAHRITLAAAQNAIAADWSTALHVTGVRP